MNDARKRVLFVDDEPRVLAGLRVSLRKQREAWEMAFAPSGEEALEHLQRAQFDVIVTDMRMPGMDGAELLRRVHEKNPGIVRIMLSGYSEREAVVRSVALAHQFLSKPCKAEDLQAVVERACALQDLIADEKLRAYLGCVESLPVLPEVYAELTAALSLEEVSHAEIGRIVGRDVGMSAKILQVVNSAFFRMPKKIAQIEQAVAYLGIDILRTLVLTLEVAQWASERLDRSQTSLDLPSLQIHAQFTGKLAVAVLGDGDRSDEAFMAGILHDVGKTVIAVHAPDKCRQAIALADEEEVPLHVAERSLFGVTHAEAGAYLLGIWGLPYPVVEAVANHHEPKRCHGEGTTVTGAVYVANTLLGEIDGNRQDGLDMGYVEELGLTGRIDELRRLAQAMLASERGTPRAA